MDKFSELKAAAMAATPGPWFRSSVQFNGITTEETFITQGNKPHLANASEKRDAIFIAAANPAVALALLAELKAKDKRIAELEATLSEMTTFRDNAVKKNARRWEEILELRAKLAMPVRLPKGTGWASAPYNHGRNTGIHECANAIRTAGFKVEGDE